VTPYYQDEAVCIYHGDCREVLPFLPKTDLLLTDPPYGIGVAKSGTVGSSKRVLKDGWGRGQSRDYGASDWDESPPSRWVLDALIEHTKHQIVFGGNYFELRPSRCWLVWDKDNTGNFADCELAWTNLDKGVQLLRYRWNGYLQEPGCRKEVRVHPTQKPEAVMRWALMQAPEGCNVLDPFMGSGTTLVAAKRLGRKAIGIERERKYCDLAVERLAQGALALEIGV
jgi:DNA modification methylase